MVVIGAMTAAILVFARLASREEAYGG
jgi:hypothetical protein